jgi:hypothetical protein
MRAFVLVSLLVAGCTTTQSPPPITAEEAHVAAVAPSASAPAEMSAEPVASAGTLTALPDGTKPRHPAGEIADGPPQPPIGSPCNGDPLHCGKSGTTAVVIDTSNMREHAAPCTLIVTQSGLDARRACVDGNRIYVSTICMACRVYRDSWTLGVVADMTPDQLRGAQSRAGVPEKPLLTMADAWRSAIAAAGRRAQRR